MKYIYAQHASGEPDLYTEEREDGLYLCDNNNCVPVEDEAEADRSALIIMREWQRIGETDEEIDDEIARLEGMKQS
jgi:hypothetical protein